jgi:hypothetical protein
MPDYQLANLDDRAQKPEREQARELEAATGPAPHPLLQLQSRIGNAGVARLIARQHAGEPVRREAAQEDELAMKRDPALIRRAGDGMKEDELEMKRDPALVRRAGDPMEEEDDENLKLKRDPALVRRAPAGVGLEGGPLDDSLARQIDGARGAGSGLPDATRNTMESSFGADLGAVRVHQDAESDSLARSMTAKAFTTGSDIFLRGDQSANDTSLMAHEMTHVVQQSSGDTGGGGGMTVGAADHSSEHEADEVAQLVNSGAARRKADESQ